MKDPSKKEVTVLKERIAALEHNVREADRRFHELADNIREVITVVDLKTGKLLYVSPGYEALWERSCASLYADPRSWVEAVHPDDLPRILKALESVATLKEEYRIVRRNGDIRWVRAHCTPVQIENSEPVRIVAFMEDITEWKRLETQLIQSQKMDAVGRMAGGIAHDFNNLLTVINGYSAMLMERIDISGDVREDLGSICKAGHRATLLTSQLLAFSRNQILQLKVIDLNDSLSAVEPILRRLIREDVELITVPGPETVDVKADPSQIEQVIMNLVINARDAIESNGAITIETGRVEFDAESGRLHAQATAGPYAMIAVSDTGRGMSALTQERIFEPFFTTKELGQGTGLGLATVYGIVKQSGGTIWVYSEEGVGSTFKIYFPLVAAQKRPEAETQADAPQSGSGTVLVVEDDDQVRTIAAGVLRKRGYNVLTASNGEEAMAVALNCPVRIDLLVTDVIMPRMGGRELAERMAPAHPDMKILFISGYTENAVIRVGVQPGASHLAKPFTPDALARKVRETLAPKTMTA